ncbi:alpha/beta hydrolase [Microbacterium sp. BWT-B31]|uniref:alpha/beta fold hydrolase n=1 Tax=Microbacterium sp. BWT-B31 TaxID=3232072 RepID=UPI003526F482
MTLFSLVHGGQQGAWCFDPLIAELDRRGYSAIAVDLPSEDPDAGLDDYARIVVASLEAVDEPVIVMGHSLGGLVLPLIAERRPVAGLAFVCAALPFPGESLVDTIAEDTASTGKSTNLLDGHGRSHRSAPDVAREVFFPDCTPEVQEWALARQRDQGERPHRETSPLQAWPDVPVTVVNGVNDLCISRGRARRTAMRLFGTPPFEIADGHFPFLTNPADVAEGLIGFAQGAREPWPTVRVVPAHRAPRTKGKQ